jgi:chromosomal replication initiation ATPase DnaA
LVGGGLLRSVGGWSVLKGLRGTGIRLKGDERILGSSDFVEQVLKKANEQLDQKSRLQASGVELNNLIEKVAGYFDIESEDLKTASKESTITLARRILCYLAVRKLMLSCTEVARQLNISPTAASRAATIGRKLPDRRKIQKQLLDI